MNQLLDLSRMDPIMAVQSFAGQDNSYLPPVPLSRFDPVIGPLWDAVLADTSGDELSSGGQSLRELDRIDRLEMELLAMGSGLEIQVIHTFPMGLYVREIIAPKDSIIVGHRHLHECFNVMQEGEVLTVINGQLQRFVAPFMGTSGADTRKASIVVKDMRWATIHPNPTNETNIEVLESLLVMKSRAYLKSRNEK